ncbi:MAG: holo-[acyl-carrier-protein] synthase [Deltaproteobacteria bacterium CG2_30_66_27]|nr:MAG: holo-[acyl-carrier-protein] synthase [Deltaproteobacteria bacterium CG2_30_66_27]PJB30749.1 MAG: holo-[acyl-carrier-protein] synthase [Deltaproteobacteria bacterium CG_4_9_14_3_um_filter_65_9]
MIAGIGVDIVDIARIQAMLDRYGERFLARVYTEAEVEYALRGAKKAERLAGRFAVKEAVMKALGTGKSQGILWRDVETVRGKFGKPGIHLHGQAVKWAKLRGGGAVHVSITHDGGKAVAFVILEKAGGK